jgi:hypothetical protein
MTQLKESSGQRLYPKKNSKEYAHRHVVVNPACVVGLGFKISLSLASTFLSSKTKSP